MVAFAPQYPAPGCPDRAKLVEFDLGLLGELELESVGEHLSSCDHCEGVLRDLHSRSDDDPVLRQLKRSMEGPPT
ncbi:serine/threonine protein kinase, partial [Singulisphaera rosea]